MFSTQSDLMDHILVNLSNYIDLWLNTRLVHDIYLKSMECHLPTIDCEKLSCKFLYNIFFFINKLLQVATLAGDVDVSPQGFYHIKHRCVYL
jgi:hypothetical protein